MTTDDGGATPGGGGGEAEVARATRALSQLRAMPYGLARTANAEAQVRRIEESGPRAALAFGLFILVESYVWGGEVEKAYVPFRRLIRLWDESPELFDEADRENFFWSFKWMVTGLVELPQIPASAITATIADMERRYAVAGNGMDAVAYAAYRWAEHREDPDVERAFELWSTTPRDPYSQCEACELGDRAVHLADRGRFAEAVDLIENVPPTTRWCATEPADMLAVLALARLDLGQPREAVGAHRRAVAALADAESDMVAARARRLELLARGGAVELALEALTQDARLLVGADSPLGRLRFLTAVVTALTAMTTAGEASSHEGSDAGLLLPSRPLALPDVPTATVGELLAWADDRARELATAFDERNGGDGRMRALARARTARRAAHALDFTVLGGVVGGDAVTPVSVSGAPMTPDDPEAPDGGGRDPGDAAERSSSAPELLATAESALAQDRPEDAAARFQEAAAAWEREGHLARAGEALAEAAHLAQGLHDLDGAHGAYARAVARLAAGGADSELRTRVLVAWAPLAQRRGATPEVLAAVATLRAEVAAAVADERPDVSADLRERDRGHGRRLLADLDDTAARLLAGDEALAVEHRAATGLDAVGLAVRAAEAYAGVGAPADAAHAFWLAGRLQAAAGEVEDAVWSLESAVEGFEIARRRDERSSAGGELVALLRAHGREADADGLVERLARPL
ncbi:hypothetical protein [Litorihabitans aurantiacus]|uniref:Tetratricopeptide repeat protein n=1 Tax=Litorihabitans aurantiacus TaxID=1930061 RepID=A0AA37UHH5_9MICO|nr:hypothetical protein [Litorihabitans aurantiacus]GMA30669.1 hypothetical protein GCM10025875_06610 [Litorihabitans aurantiacus]